MSELSLAMRIALKNDLSGPMKAALGDVSRTVKALESSFKAVDSEAKRVGATLDGFNRGENALAGVNGQLMGTRNLLREIALGAGRATRDLGRMPAGNALRGGMAVARGANMAFQGMQAGNLALQYQLAKPIDYELRLAHLANTAYSDRDTLGRKQGAIELNKSVMNAVRIGKGTREHAVEALDTMIASNAFSIDESKSLLPTVTKAATATGANPQDLAQIAISAKQIYGIRADQVGRMFDVAATSGQLGGFELRDMAKHLPRIMAMSRGSGMKGMNDFAALGAHLQVSRIASGSADQAAMFAENLFSKITAQDTANDFKKQDIDLYGTLAGARLKGIDSVTAFIALVDSLASKDKKYVEMKRKASSAKTPEDKRAAHEAAADILRQRSVGSIAQDRQFAIDLVAQSENQDKRHSITEKSLNSSGTIDKNFDVIGSTYANKQQSLQSEQEAAKTNLFGSLSGPMGTLTERTVELYQKYPALGEAMEGLKIGANTAAAALAAVGITGLLTGGGAAAAGGGVLARFGIGAGVGAAGAGAAGLGLGAAMSAGAAGLGGYALGSYAYNHGGGDLLGGVIDRATGLKAEQDKILNINNKIMLDGRQIAESNNRVNARNNRRE